jgi:hypothetical protein
MKSPSCPDHGRIVLDLAQGRLDDLRAAEAEQILESCPVCASWWQANLEGEAVLGVDHVVEHAFAAFQPPRRRRIALWMPAAAALLIMVGAGLLWNAGDRDPVSVDRSSGGVELVRGSFDGDVNGDGVVGVTDSGFELVSDEASADSPIFESNVDSGDLAGWSSRS